MGMTLFGAISCGPMNLLLAPGQARAVPAYARKYNVNGAVCHTSPRGLNTYGKRCLKNGDQIPSTEDSSVIGKRKFDVLKPDVTNHYSLRWRGDAVQYFYLNQPFTSNS
jgi:hypothetical protein